MRKNDSQSWLKCLQLFHTKVWFLIHLKAMLGLMWTSWVYFFNGVNDKKQFCLIPDNQYRHQNHPFHVFLLPRTDRAPHTRPRLFHMDLLAVAVSCRSSTFSHSIFVNTKLAPWLCNNFCGNIFKYSRFSEIIATG